MVLAAPVFLLSQTAGARAFYAANREPLLRLALGSTIAYLSLRLLSKSYEASALSDDLERAARWRAHMETTLLAPAFVSRTAACVRGSADGEASLRAALGGAMEEAAGALVAADAAAQRRNAWVVGLQERMPASGVLEGGRRRALAAAADARALASGSDGAGSGSGSGSADSVSASSGSGSNGGVGVGGISSACPGSPGSPGPLGGAPLAGAGQGVTGAGNPPTPTRRLI